MKNAPKILIVDDIAKNIQVVGGILKESGYDIAFAQDGRTAINQVESGDFDLILLDIMMPEMSGFEVCEILKNNPETRHIPVIFLTAKTDTEDIVKAFEIGAVDYVSKPFNSKELLSRVNTHIELKKSQDTIRKQNAKLKTEINTRETYEKEIIDKNDLLEKTHANITASITYAKKIQQAILPGHEILEEHFDEHFVIYLPKDIVSGDFYVVKELKEHLIVAAADCTGHGVPGALLSMLGASLLNEVIRTCLLLKPSIVLNYLREQLKISLNLNESAKTIQDGIDIALCIINTETYEAQFSGAYNNMYVFRESDSGEPEIHVLKGDRMPIGVYRKEKGFTDQNIQLMYGDQIYMLSDGYPHQIGEKTKRKFLIQNLIALLKDIYKKPMDEQKEILLKSYSDWKGNVKQLDDVLLMGLRI